MVGLSAIRESWWAVNSGRRTGRYRALWADYQQRRTAHDGCARPGASHTVALQLLADCPIRVCNICVNYGVARAVRLALESG